MKLFNSMSQKIEEFKPITEGQVSMYVCGPTVYNYPHIGNARPIVVFDTLKRTFMALGYKVKMVSNYTDVDDKIIKVAKECGISEKEVTEKFIKAYNDDRLALHAMMPDAAPKVTETMDAIIAFIDLLVKKEHAYVVDGDVYFRVSSVENYGKLSNQQIDDLMVGARIDENSKKENPLDFTLWKRTEEGIKWESPWSVGRPGWHTECVVMINKEFDGNHLIDIHGGGMDLKFPHHENEIAQSRAAYETGIANYWIHNGMVNIDGEKMSKSLGNVIWAKDMIEKIGGDTLRWLFLSSHYRSPLNINEEAIETAKKELNKVKTPLKQAYVKAGLAGVDLKEEYDVESFHTFLTAMEDDLNTPNAFAAIFDVVKQLNQVVRQKEIDFTALGLKVNAVEKMLDVLGIENHRIVLSEEDKNLHAEWRNAVTQKDFELADKFRAQLIEKGIL
ncbi:cysteine--tRNA ligase [Amedibacterium intestinale]|uniref:cysteine--tRNA ligase n=1 Tax=Amedibacterium intestinale TaxID=2583452 RepID=UPI000E4EE3C3|nr:cysteine--tRNA ligase [Amedibacterium intestinale]RHO22455.1 cysteine--tRNA ligase [Eubacterium sp. AM18-26]RHO24512.1 cysteine--tRNA ligase [Eubacterium sp. AM18-10LB-B]RHO32749.1 cysteine--tRNA ligase [Erysipelotrichaceae bacterium AM17-60]BBK62539.1 cysteine--tRNA ligase [Amedibacterium intestinale]